MVKQFCGTSDLTNITTLSSLLKFSQDPDNLYHSEHKFCILRLLLYSQSFPTRYFNAITAFITEIAFIFKPHNFMIPIRRRTLIILKYSLNNFIEKVVKVDNVFFYVWNLLKNLNYVPQSICWRLSAML